MVAYILYVVDDTKSSMVKKLFIIVYTLFMADNTLSMVSNILYMAANTQPTLLM